MVAKNVEVIVGTYEELTLGFTLQLSKSSRTFTNSFTDHSHTASVRSVAISVSGIAATGSADETIKLFNLRKRVELGTLIHHEGSVVGLQFYDKTHMFSFSEDGTIAVWQTDNWECLRTLRGHKAAVYSFTVHPSGKLALSCGKDKSLRVWNLITGRLAYITNIKEVADVVSWSPDGQKYIVVIGSQIDVYSFETASIIHQIQMDNRICSVAFLKDDVLAVGCERGAVVLYDISLHRKLHEIDSGTNRVKAMNVFEDKVTHLVVASSDGFIKLYRICLEDSASHKLIAEVNTGFRLLCIAVRTSSQTDENDEAPPSGEGTSQMSAARERVTVSYDSDSESDAGDSTSPGFQQKKELATENKLKKRKRLDKSKKSLKKRKLLDQDESVQAECSPGEIRKRKKVARLQNKHSSKDVSNSAGSSKELLTLADVGKTKKNKKNKNKMTKKNKKNKNKMTKKLKLSKQKF